jgi:hypothetical protein
MHRNDNNSSENSLLLKPYIVFITIVYVKSIFINRKCGKQNNHWDKSRPMVKKQKKNNNHVKWRFAKQRYLDLTGEKLSFLCQTF